MPAINSASVLQALRQQIVRAWPDVRQVPYVTTTEQVAALGNTSGGAASGGSGTAGAGKLPMAIIQPGRAQITRGGGRAILINLAVTCHRLVALVPGRTAGDGLMADCEGLLAALLNDIWNDGKLGGLVEAVQPQHILIGDDNPVQMMLARTSNNVALAAGSVTVVYQWSV